ncbi:MAG: hypothetical protein ACRD0K_16190 [Egibacteraceae bacterium]
MTLVERGALMLADMLSDEGIWSSEVDPDIVRHLVSEAGGFPTPLRRAYDQVYRRWTDGGSPRDRLACLLLSHAHIAAARVSSSVTFAPRRNHDVIPGLGMFLDWSHDERPVWEVSIHYRHPDSAHADLDPAARERIATELRKTGMTRHVRVSIDEDGAGYGLAFHIHADDHAQAEATAENIAQTCLHRASMPFLRNISARSASRCDSLQIST